MSALAVEICIAAHTVALVILAVTVGWLGLRVRRLEGEDI
jgi:hypothetical protein